MSPTTTLGPRATLIYLFSFVDTGTARTEENAFLHCFLCFVCFVGLVFYLFLFFVVVGYFGLPCVCVALVGSFADPLEQAGPERRPPPAPPPGGAAGRQRRDAAAAAADAHGVEVDLATLLVHLPSTTPSKKNQYNSVKSGKTQFTPVEPSKTQ